MVEIGIGNNTKRFKYETKENYTFECVSFIFEGYNGRYGIGFVIGKNGHESLIAERDEYVLKSLLKWHCFRKFVRFVILIYFCGVLNCNLVYLVVFNSLDNLKIALVFTSSSWKNGNAAK